ncbi:Beta-glucosidase 1B [Rhizophlyctis rosea]|uniref:beta-glucosidase n=1 Tax=Rhizophlyctis rosea TaxID=64517 RepID=A0AAD5SLF6_9FUNG|nr:Beta-glucosidase 1B [Rhizophlyctis rosea]
MTVTKKLPKDFAWGFATASYQIEGAVNEGGRGKTIWDTFSHTPGKVAKDDNGDVACDTYHRWNEDVQLLKNYGAKVYRFSIAWSRIIPLGGREDPINPEGIAWYNQFIDALLANGITPFVTLFHWDLPQALYDRYRGPLNTNEFAADFERYARVAFEAFGDRVRNWITFNEPEVFSTGGFANGVHAPGRTSDRSKSPEGDTATEPWRAGHSLLVAHAHAVKAYRADFKAKQGGQIGITLNGDWAEPFDDTAENVAAAQRKLEFNIGRFADPVYLSGDYPPSMRAQLGDRLPTFTKEESALLKGSSDFYGMNHYTTNYVWNRNEPPTLDDQLGNVLKGFISKDGEELGPPAESPWLRPCPWGFRKLLNWLWNRYQTPIYITENGCSVKGESDLGVEQAVHDTYRVNYFKGYLENLLLAVFDDGVQIRGYMAWSLLDNFEWADGYTCRFGVTYVDYKTLERTPKESGKFIKKFFEENVEA